MNPHPDDLLPFYANCTLTPEQSVTVESHLATCQSCRAQLAAWQKLASTIQQSVDDQLLGSLKQTASDQPSFSPWIYASLRARPSLQQAFQSAGNLIWAQRIFLTRGGLMPILAALLLLGTLASQVVRAAGSVWTGLPLLIIIPLIAALSTAFLSTYDEDPACEIISAAPTTAATLVFARLTLSLVTISLLSFVCSLLLAIGGHSLSIFFNLTAIWLGPMLVLSALTTTLSLTLPPTAAAGITLTIWGIVVTLLIREQAGAPLLQVSLLPLLHPGWALLMGQALLAGLLWLISWRWLAGSAPFSWRLERRS